MALGERGELTTLMKVEELVRGQQHLAETGHGLEQWAIILGVRPASR